MPLLKLQTNVKLDQDEESSLSAVLSQKVSEWTDKPEAYVQIVVECDVSMRFGGTVDATAFIELRSLGFYGHQPAEVSHELCAILERELSISKDRIFINFFDMARENWGWNGKTFA